MLTLRVGGVPEHFNLPWHLLLESNWPAENGLAISWTDFPAGTGAMIKALANNEIDLAMLVTEGAAAGMQQADCPYQPVSFYTQSPLLWGIHVPAASTLQHEHELFKQRYAISRFGSGSHLMAKIHARQQGHHLDDSQFVLIENLQGARNAFKNGAAEVFFWERFTTKPFVDNGEFRWLGNFPPPWPGFTVVARRTLPQTQANQLPSLLSAVFQQAMQLVSQPAAAELIASRYGIAAQDASEWLSHTRWLSEPELDNKTFVSVQQLLDQA